MRIVYTKIHPDAVRSNRNFYKNHVKRAFVMYCAYEGLFDGVLTKKEIEQAKHGRLPDDLNVHHKVPLSGSMDLFVNDFSNLAIIHKNTHEFINKYVFAPQLRQLYDKPFGTEIEIEVPNYDFIDRDGIKKERMIEAENEKLHKMCTKNKCVKSNNLKIKEKINIENSSENPRVGGSIPSLTTTSNPREI